MTVLEVEEAPGVAEGMPMPAKAAWGEGGEEEGYETEGDEGNHPDHPLEEMDEDMRREEAMKDHIRKVWGAYSGSDLQKKLYAAAATNNVRGIGKLTKKHGVDVNARMDNGRTAMFAAAYAGHADAIKALVEAGGDVCLKDDDGATPLHFACFSGCSPGAVDAILQAGADPNLPDPFGSTPLLLALEHDTEEGRGCVNALLGSGLVNANGLKGAPRSPLHHLILLRDDLETVQALLEVGGANPLQPDGEGNSPLHYAVNLGRTESIKQILASELSLSASTAAVGSSLVQPNAAGLLPLHLAAIQGNALLCNFLSSMLPAAEPEEEAGQGAAMSHPGSRANSGRVAAYPEETGDAPRIIMNVHLDAVDASGHTPLHLAAAEGHLECVQALVGAGASLEVLNPQGLTALHLAIAKRKTEVVTELVEAGTDLKRKLHGSNSSYLHLAAINGLEDLIPMLVEHGAPLMDVDSDGRTALHAAAFSGSDKGCRALVSLGISPGVQDLDGKLPMHCAAQGGQVDALQYLLQTGANLRPEPITIDARTFTRRDLMYLAALAGQEEVMALLLDLDMGDMKDHTDKDGRTSLHAAAYGGNPTCVFMLLDAGWDVNAIDYRGRTPLFAAAEGDSSLVLKMLIEAGASVLVKSKTSDTPLHAAAHNGFVEGILCLVEAGHEVNAFDHRRRTPLHEASYMGQKLAGMALVRLGADIEATDKYGLSPVAAAVAASHRDTAKALEDEACRSSDFQKRDSVDAAYRTMEKPQKPGLKDDIDDVPEKFARNSSGRKGLESIGEEFSEADSEELFRRMSPGSPSSRRRRGASGRGNADASHSGRSHLGEEEDAPRVKQHVKVDGVDDPDMKELLTQLNYDIARREAEDSDEDEDKHSLGSSLGSDYEYSDDAEGTLSPSPEMGELGTISEGEQADHAKSIKKVATRK